MKKSFLFLLVLLLGTLGQATVILHDTFADGSRLETNLPYESALYASSPADVTVSVGSVRQAMSTASRRLHTYFADQGSPLGLNVGDKLVATIEFAPCGALYSSTSRNFRFGLFYDPTSPQHRADNIGDSGVSNSWQDATGYAVQFSLSSGTASTIQVGKRTDFTVTSLLGTSGAYQWGTGTGGASNLVLDRVYTMTFVLDYQAADLMQVDFTFMDDYGFSTSASLTDNGLGGKPIYTNFDFLLFRFSAASGTADIIDIRSIKIEYIPEPATLALLGIGGLLAFRRKR
ncbi:MAG: PEP-CTERM sorting domain-containing protein [Anaerohalosphaeraceae bacterium]